MECLAMGSEEKKSAWKDEREQIDMMREHLFFQPRFSFLLVQQKLHHSSIPTCSPLPS